MDGATVWQSPVLLHFAILYVLPLGILAVPLPSLWTLAALSPASAWVRLFPGGAEAIQRFPLYHLGLLPSLPVCLAGACLAGVALMAVRPPAPNSGGVRGRIPAAPLVLAPYSLSLTPPELGAGGENQSGIRR